jgi:hypothetical protein
MTANTIFSTRARLPAALALCLALCLPLGGCASDSDSLAAMMVSPGKYDFYRCDQMAVKGNERAERARELKLLMDKAAQGPGGALANTLAYRNEYLTAIGELKELEKAALAKKCETPWRSISDGAMW